MTVRPLGSRERVKRGKSVVRGLRPGRAGRRGPAIGVGRQRASCCGLASCPRSGGHVRDDGAVVGAEHRRRDRLDALGVHREVAPQLLVDQLRPVEVGRELRQPVGDLLDARRARPARRTRSAPGHGPARRRVTGSVGQALDLLVAHPLHGLRVALRPGRDPAARIEACRR